MLSPMKPASAASAIAASMMSACSTYSPRM
jgi:hypothetical protein